MKITVIGPGAIGTLLAALLSNANVEISLLVKPKHKELLSDGIIVLDNFKGRRLEKKIKIVTKLDDPDWIILAVKSYDVDNLIELLRNSSAPILCCQNGIKTYLQLTEKIGKDRIAYMVTGIGSSKIETGEAEFRGSGFTFIGEASGVASPRLINLSEVIKKSGITCEIVDDVLSYVWLKTIINSSINPVAAHAKVSNGELKKPELNKIWVGIAHRGKRLEEFICETIVLAIQDIQVLLYGLIRRMIYLSFYLPMPSIRIALGNHQNILIGASEFILRFMK